mmetsp:Transcript_23739/g.51861  ORF Transcript_23739/g.51861 Transcript_23739/m.51861 type:complete len:267 (-) Transcript_23739:339-1139(-)
MIIGLVQSILGVASEEEEVAVVGLRAQHDAGVVDSSRLQKLHRLLWEGDPIHSGTPGASVCGDCDVDGRSFLHAGFADSTLDQAASSLGCLLCREQGHPDVLRRQSARFADGTLKQTSGARCHVLKLHELCARALAVNGHLRGVATEGQSLTLNPTKCALDVQNSPISCGAACIQVLLESHPPNWSSAVVEGNADHFVKGGQGTHVVGLRLAELVGSAIDEDHHRKRRPCTVSCRGRSPNVGLQAIFTSICLRRVRCDLHASRAPH